MVLEAKWPTGKKKSLGVFPNNITKHLFITKATVSGNFWMLINEPPWSPK